MGAVVERFGGLVAAQASAHPGRARWLLSSAYRLVGAQMRYIPPQGNEPRPQLHAVGHLPYDGQGPVQAGNLRLCQRISPL